MFDVKRREFIAMLGSAAVSPLDARAQQPGRMPRVGFLTGQAENDPDAQTRLAAFLQALQELGWIDGRTVRMCGRCECLAPQADQKSLNE